MLSIFQCSLYTFSNKVLANRHTMPSFEVRLSCNHIQAVLIFLFGVQCTFTLY